jgi:hypothetical protein
MQARTNRKDAKSAKYAKAKLFETQRRRDAETQRRRDAETQRTMIKTLRLCVSAVHIMILSTDH